MEAISDDDENDINEFDNYGYPSNAPDDAFFKKPEHSLFHNSFI
jgi:hypothetical protein